MKKRLALWSLPVILILVAGLAYGQNTIIKRLIGVQDISWATGGSGATEVFTYTTPKGLVITLNKPDATYLKYRSAGAGSVEGSATADKVPPAQSYTSLAATITAIGSTQATVKLLPGTYPVSTNLTIPANIVLKPERGALLSVATGITLTINGPIVASPYQIFAWTGTGAINLSSCPNNEFPIEWMGGLTTSSDVAAALNKYVTAFGPARKVVKLGHGVYTLLTPIVVNTAAGAGEPSGHCLSIIGQNFNDSVLWVNVGANIAIHEGVDEDGGDPGVYISDLVMKNFTIAGGAAACTTALKLEQCGNIDLDLNFWLGSTDFACIIQNCDWAKARLYLTKGRAWPSAITLATLAEPAKGILLTNGNGASINGNNASEFYINGESVGTNPQLEVSPVYAVGGASGETMEITGSFENWTGSPIIIDGKGAISSVYQRAWIKFRNIHIENGSAGGTIPISNITNVIFEGFENAVDSCVIQMSNTKDITWSNYFLRGGITIAPDCQSTVFGPGITEGGVYDYSGDTRYINGPNINTAFNEQPIGPIGTDPVNYIYNTQMNRWQSDRIDGGWEKDANTVYTKETSNVHILPNCAKMVYTDTAPLHAGYHYYDLDSYQLQQFKGKFVTYSANLQVKTGDVLTTYPITTLSFVCPARTNSTKYYLGQGVNDGSGNQYVCVAVSGDQLSGGGAPAWNTGDGALTVDNHVTWRCGMCYSNTGLGDNFGANVGSWYRVSTGAYCPTNVASGQVTIAQYPQTGGAASTLYLAEPALMIGRQIPRSYVANNPNEVLIGTIKMTSDSLIPTDGSSNINGKWSCLGDICYNTGSATGLADVEYWRCTVAGLNGTSSTWTARDLVP